MAINFEMDGLFGRIVLFIILCIVLVRVPITFDNIYTVELFKDYAIHSVKTTIIRRNTGGAEARY